MTDDKNKLGRILTSTLNNRETGPCPSTEDIAALAEGAIHGSQREGLLRHIASCPECYDIFSLTTELVERPAKKRPAIFHPISMAASILIITISVFIIFKSGVRLQPEEVPLQIMDTVEEAAAEESFEPALSEQTDKEQLKAAPGEKFKKDALRQKKQAPPKPAVKKLEEGAKMEFAGKGNRSAPAAPATLSGGNPSLDTQLRFRECLTQTKKELSPEDNKYKSGLSPESRRPDIADFLKNSTPGTPEHAFFQLAAKGFYYRNTWYGETATAQSTLEWKILLPRLNGIYREIAQQTVTYLERIPETTENTRRR